MKFFYYEDQEIDIIRRVKQGEKILIFVATVDKLRKLRERLKQYGDMDVACLCSKYRPEAKEFEMLDEVIQDGVLLHQITLTTSVLYNGVDIKDPALKYIVSELWNPLVNAQIVGRKRPLNADDTCAVYFMQYGKKRLENLHKEVQKQQIEPVGKFRRKSKNPEAWQAYLHDDATQYILNNKCRTVVLDPREGCYCLRKRAYLQALLESSVLTKMLHDGYQQACLKAIDESLLDKIEELDPPLFMDYLEEHLNEKMYYKDWQKIFYEVGHIRNSKDGHLTKSMPNFTAVSEAIAKYGYELHVKKETSGMLRDKAVWWVTKCENHSL